MVFIFILRRVLFHFFYFYLLIFLDFALFFGILGGVPGFLGGVPGFLGVFRVLVGVPVFLGCSGMFRCSWKYYMPLFPHKMSVFPADFSTNHSGYII